MTHNIKKKIIIREWLQRMAEKKKEKLNKEKVHLLRGEPYQKNVSHTTNRQGREVTTCGNNIYKDLQKKGG